jgi:hypothetical protein
MSRGKHPTANIPRELRKQIRTLVSKKSDEAIDLVVNLTGKYISTENRRKLKKKAEIEVGTRIEEAITESYHTALEIAEEYQQKKLKTDLLKENFYKLTDACLKPSIPKIPKNVHAMDYLFQVCQELKDIRFNWVFLKDTKYAEYLTSLEKLTNELQKSKKIGDSWKVLEEFRHSKDFYLLLQATFQKLIKYYEFLARDFRRIEKKQLDKYLEIYEELSGAYEKLISLIATLIQLLQTDANYKYEIARRNKLYANELFIKKSGWAIFVSGFNRNIRNAIAHNTCKIDIIKKTAEFIDRNKTIILTFREVQKETKELGALLLILPHVLISIFCLPILSFKEFLDSLP